MVSLPITVVIATYNRAPEVLETVGRLRELPDQPRIIVVDNGSSDGTSHLLRLRYPDIRVLTLPRNIGAAARNAGIQAADSDYVALCDDDTWWSPSSLTRAAEALHRHPRLAVVTGRVLIYPRAEEDPTCRQMAQSPLPADPDVPGIPILGFLAGASMIRRSAFLAVGGFEPKLFIGREEGLAALDLAAAGWAMSYLDEVLVYHRPSPSRDRGRRIRFLRRNGLWITWLRRPLFVALKYTARSIGRAWRNPHEAAGVAGAFAGLHWVIRRRRVLPRELEAALVTLEDRFQDQT